jgi:TolB-like protein/Tfp pilus assembly protein PilF
MQIWSSEIKELEKLHETVKSQFPELEKELEQLIRTEDANVVMLYSRRCLEVIITDLCECELKRPRKTEPLKGIIDKLLHEGKVPSHIITSMDSLNSLSTYGTHPKDFDPEQVKPVLSNLAIIIKWYLKYKDSIKVAEGKHEEENYKIEITASVKREKLKTKRKLIIVLSGTILVIVIAIAILFTFNVIGKKDKGETVKELAKSIAVLPFKNYSGDAAQEYMSDGLTDEIINHLFKIASFDKVVSLNSVLTYKGTDKRLPQIADELKVNYILEGTYKKIGDQVRVTAQLIEPKNDQHLWQNEYDRPYKEIIAIQSDIALQIADQVKAFLTDSEKQIIRKIPTTNQEAYEIIQQALNLLRNRSYDSIDQLINMGLKAIQLDPDFAHAYAWTGLMYIIKGSVITGSVEMQTIGWDAAAYFEKALELDPDNSAGHFGLAMLNDYIRWDHIKADNEFTKVLGIEPNNPVYIGGYIEWLIKMNRIEDVWDYMDTTEASFRLIQSQILSGNKKEASRSIKKYKESIGMDIWLGESYIWFEEYDSAKLCLEQAIQNNDPRVSRPRIKADLALAYYKTKNWQQAQNIVSELINTSKVTKAGSPEYCLGWYYSGIGEVDSAFYWLEKAYNNRSPEMPWLKVTPQFKSLKNDDRYWDLYARTGHKAYDEYRKKLKKKL